MKKSIKYCLITILLLLISLPLFYFFNGRIIKFYEKEPYPLFNSDFTDINTDGYIFDDPETRYADYMEGTLYNISDYGAISAYYEDENFDDSLIQTNTQAINEAIKDASSTNGIVLIPQGDYIAGTINLQSNIILRLKGNLIGSRSRDDYEPRHFLIGDNIRNVTLEGDGGKIMGEGEYFWNNPIIKPLATHRAVSDLRMLQLDHFLAKREKKDNRPSPFIFFRNCEQIIVRNLIVNNSPGWTLTFELSNYITIQDTVLHNNIRGGNVDGIDIVGTSNVNISNVLVSTADDGIVLKNPKLDPSVSMSNITVRNARIISTCNGFKIGTETYSDISNVEFLNSEIITTEFYTGGISGVAIESVDGSVVSNILVKNITMEGVLAPLFIRVGNRNRYDDKNLKSLINNITIKNIHSSECQLPSIISGVRQWNGAKGEYSVRKATNISLNDFKVEYLNTPERLLFQNIVPESPAGGPEVWMFGDVPAYGIYIRHADVEYENIEITPRAGNTRKMIVVDSGGKRDLINGVNILTLIVSIILLFLTLISVNKIISQVRKRYPYLSSRRSLPSK